MEFSARLNDSTELPCLYGERGELPEPMNGVVEADETYIGGLAPPLRKSAGAIASFFLQ